MKAKFLISGFVREMEIPSDDRQPLREIKLYVGTDIHTFYLDHIANHNILSNHSWIQEEVAYYICRD